MATEYSFDDYVAEARPAPFRLRIGNDDVIEIEYPNAETLLDIDEASSARRILQLLCGDNWNRVFNLVRDKPGTVVERLAGDMRDHFGLSGNRRAGGRGVVHLINRYGEALESDLFESGWDLLDYFRGKRPWTQLLRIADNLPPYSRYKFALQDDDELQRWREQRYRGKPPPPRPPSLRSWTVHDEILAAIHDLGEVLRTTMIALEMPKGKKAPAPKFAKRPKTAAERADSRRDREMAEGIVKQVLPHKKTE